MDGTQQIAFGNGLIFFKKATTSNPRQNDVMFRSHSHNTVEIYCFLKGDARFVVEGNIYTLKTGSVLLMASGQTHNLLIDACRVYERTVIQIAPAALPRQFENISGYLYGGCNFFELTRREQDWFEESCSLIINAGEDARINLLASFLPLLFTMLSAKLSTAGGSHYEDDIVTRTIGYINKNLSSDLSLNSISSAVYFSKAAINRKFREIMGCTVWDYVLRRRIFTARRRIFETDNITAAFEESGFGDYSSFFRAYKKIVGMSPNKDLKAYKAMKRET